MNQPRWIALLRGVNVGGANRVPMAELRGLCQKAGWRDVQSYIASGNLVFDAEGPAERLAAELSDLIARNMGPVVEVVVSVRAPNCAPRWRTAPLPPRRASSCTGFSPPGR